MDLLSKLDKIEIQITDKFPPEDMEYCRQEEKNYQEAYSIYSEVAFIVNDANAKLKVLRGGDRYHFGSFDECEDKVYECSEKFIEKICGYLRRKYNVTIDEPSWETESEDERGRRRKKDRYDMVPLKYILDSVHDQMGGMSFEEKAFDELVSTARAIVISHNGKSKYSIKGTRLVIEGFYNSRKDYWGSYEGTVESKHRAFFKILSHFESGMFDIARRYDFLCDYQIKEKNGVYDKHYLSSTVIPSIKLFKNGKVEVEFKDYVTAVKFMETYFPGIPQQAAA